MSRRVPTKAFLFGDEQGSTSVMMPAHVGASGAVAPATLADASAATRTSYTPYGALRGADNAALDRGWLGQVEDRVDGASGTGLTYLNARYYDPATMRFISPDPLMNPGDPKTLDPYRYADNNPVVFTDATGLTAACSGLSGANEAACLKAFNKGWAQKAPGRVVNKPGTGKFWGDAAKGYAGTMWSSAAQATPYGTYKAYELLFTDPKGFGQQYVDGANWAKGYGEDWLHQVGVAGDILQGDRSVWEYGTELCHSKMMLNLCDSWDSGDGKAFGSKVAIGVQTIGGLAMGGGGSAATTAAKVETYYRAMSADDFASLLSNGRVSATGETFISTDLAYSAGYEGTLVELTTREGTLAQLEALGVRDTSAALTAQYPDMPVVSSGWGGSSAYFKWESGTLNIGLGKGPALDAFNDSLICWAEVG